MSTALTIGTLVGAILGIVIALKILDSLNPDNIIRNLSMVGGIMLALVVVAKILDKGGKTAGSGALKSGVGLFALVLSIVGVIVLLKLLEVVKIDWKKIIQNIGSVITIFIALGVLLAMTNLIGPNASGAATTILAMVGALAAMALLMYLISKMKWEDLGKGIAGVGALTVFLGALLYVAQFAKGATGPILALAVCIGVIGYVLYSLSALDPGALQNATLCLGGIMAMLAILSLVLGYAEPATSAVIKLIVILGSVAIVLALLATFTDAAQVASIAQSLALVFVALGAAMVLISVASAIAEPSWGGILKMVVIMAAVGLLFGLMSALTDVDKVATLAQALGPVFVEIGAAMLLISVASAIATVAIPGMIALGVAFVIITAVIIALGAAANKWEWVEDAITKGLELLNQLAEGIGTAIGTFVSAIVSAGLDNMIATVQGLAEALTSWQSEMDGIAGITVPSGIDTLISAIGSATWSGFGSGLKSIVTEMVEGKSAMEQFQSDASGLSSALKEWQSEMDGISEITVPEGVGELCSAIGEATLTGLVSGLESTIPEMVLGKSAMETFSADAGGLGSSLSEWQTEMEGISEITVPTGVTEICSAIGEANLTGFGSALESTITEMTTGKTAMENFQSDASGLASALKDWQTEMEGISTITVPDNIDELTESIGKINMSSLVSSVTSMINGFFSEGDTSMDTFKENTTKLATALTDWQTEMDKIGAITVPTQAIEDLVKSIEKVPKAGGIFGAFKKFFEGSDDMEGFSENLKKLGEGIQGFTTALGEDIDLDKMTVAAEAASVLGELGNALKGQDFGGWFHEGDLSKFGDNLTEFGKKLQEFAAIDIDTAKLSTLADSAHTLGRFGNLIQHLDISEENLSSLDSAITQVKTSMDTMKEIDISSGDVANTGKVTKFVANVKDLINSINDAAAVEAGSTSNFKAALDEMNDAILQSSSNSNGKGLNDDADLSSVGNSMANTMATGITDNASLVTDALSTVMTGATSAISDTSVFSSAGTGMMTAMMLGITGSSSLISTAISGAVSSAKAAIDTSGFSSVGASMMSGLASGISSGKSAAINAAAAAAAEALAAAKAKLDINSPSKKMIEVGENFTEGFSIGIKNLTYKAKRTAGNMAQGTIDSFQQAADAVLSVLSADVSGGPVIRPVLDLSEVKLGASKINDMFGGRVPVSVAANANVISSNMSNRDTVSNRDILDALDRLNSSLGGPRGDSITINGITYDDGSNVYMAVKDLVKAVRVGRRV